MIDQPAETAVTPQADGQQEASDESVKDVFARLYADGRAYAAAEAERQKLRAGIAATGIRNAAILGGIALILVFASIVALLIGLIIALAQHVGPLSGTLIVVGGALLIVVALLIAARGCISRMRNAIKP